MKIKITKPLTIRPENTNDLISFRCGEIADVDIELGNKLVSCGLATLHKDVIPEGTKTITANGSYDISIYENAIVHVGTVTVTYNINGGSGSISSQTVIAGNSINLDDGAGITAQTGLKFVGWATTSDAETPDVTSPYKAEADITLYAVYADDEDTYTITYDVNGGTGTIAPVAVIAGNSINLDDGTGLTAPEDKEFAGWATTSDAETPDVTSPYTPESDITLYAVYQIVPLICTATFDLNGGSGDCPPISATAGETIELYSGEEITPPQEWQTFIGWVKDLTSVAQSRADSPFCILQDETFNAFYWNKNDTFNVNFRCNGENLTSKSANAGDSVITYDETEVPVVPGFEITGWRDVNTDKVYQLGSPYKPFGASTLEAVLEFIG